MELNDQDVRRMNRVLRHRLRNWATGIQNAISLMAKELDDRLAPQEKEYFPLILNECHDLQRLTDRMSLLFDDTPSGGDGSLAEILDVAISHVQANVPTLNIDLSMAPGLEKAVIAGRAWMLVAFEEIVRNAAEAKVGGRIVVIGELDAQSGLILHITDEGAGIAADQADNVFLPFFTTRPRHLGLGLAIARRGLNQIGGMIVINRSASGSCMDLIVPVDSDPQTNGRFGMIPCLNTNPQGPL